VNCARTKKQGKFYTRTYYNQDLAISRPGMNIS